MGNLGRSTQRIIWYDICYVDMRDVVTSLRYPGTEEKTDAENHRY
jgi:hypothetical protein